MVRGREMVRLEFGWEWLSLGIQIGLLVSFLMKVVGRLDEDDVAESSGSVRECLRGGCIDCKCLACL